MIQLDVDIALIALQRMPILLGLGAEPMWMINERSRRELQSLLEKPFQQYGGEELYKTPAEKAAVLFFQTIKGHRFENGNKRTAVILTLAFLRWNGYWLKMSSNGVYRLALKTAEGANNREALDSLNKVFDKQIERISLFGFLKAWAEMVYKSITGKS